MRAVPDVLGIVNEGLLNSSDRSMSVGLATGAPEARIKEFWMEAKVAISAITEFAVLQGKLVRRYLSLYEPRDLERFRDVPNGTLSLESATWTHRRHGAGVLFVDPNGVRVNAHVGMAEYPEGIDGGRLFEYLESLGIASVVFKGREYVVAALEVDQMMHDMVLVGLLRAATAKGRFHYRVFELPGAGEREERRGQGHT